MSLLHEISVLASAAIAVGTLGNPGVILLSHAGTAPGAEPRPGTGPVTQYRQILMLERELPAVPGGTLVIDVPDGNIEILGGAANTASVKVFVGTRERAWGAEVLERIRFAIRGEGDQIRISASNPRVERSEWRRNYGVAVTVAVQIPSVFNTQVVTRDGDVRVADLEGRVTLRTYDGDVRVDRVRGPAVSVRTSDGTIRARGIEAPSIDLNTGDADVHVSDLSGALFVSTGDGDIRARLTSANDVRLNTRDGDIAIYAPTDLAAEVDFYGEDLDLGSGFRLEGGRVTKRAVRGSLNGGGRLLQARTGDGTIMLHRR